MGSSCEDEVWGLGMGSGDLLWHLGVETGWEDQA